MEPVAWGRRRAGTSTGCRRVWSLDEEKILVAGLKELVARGYKCDNGFKSGYGGILENMLMNAFPGTDLRSDPHITSKIHVWKKHYACLRLMLANSGIGLNGSNYNIDTTPEVWEQHIKLDPTARNLRNKSFPFYNDWIEIFGKDRATGEDTQTFADVVHEVLNNNVHPEVSTGVGETGADTTNGPQVGDFGSEYTREETNSATKVKSKGMKRKISEDLDSRFVDTISSFCDKTDDRMGQIVDRMGELAQRVGAKFDATKKRGLVYESLDLLGFLSVEDRVSVALYMCNNSKEIDVFFSLPAEAKAVMVRKIIKKQVELGEM